MSGDRAIPEFQIARMAIAPGDVLVVKIDGHISMERLEKAREHIAASLPPGVLVLVIDRQVELSVLTRTEIEARITA
jgi:hypothetical protein